MLVVKTQESWCNICYWHEDMTIWYFSYTSDDLMKEWKECIMNSWCLKVFSLKRLSARFFERVHFYAHALLHTRFITLTLFLSARYVKRTLDWAYALLSARFFYAHRFVPIVYQCLHSMENLPSKSAVTYFQRTILFWP